jgi:hypothetical protein
MGQNQPAFMKKLCHPHLQLNPQFVIVYWQFSLTTLTKQTSRSETMVDSSPSLRRHVPED